jgi:glycosyltransferase involved in cell wall biosynthesis
VGVRAHWHLVTSEYPPTVGGVSDYTRAVARALAEAGDSVDVWCPASPAADPQGDPGVRVHPVFERFTRAELRRLSAELDRCPAPRTLFVQWVPHGYGRRSMNLALCTWLLSRARGHGDRVELMVHEPSLAFGEGSARQSAVAVVHRVMLMLALGAASCVWMSSPAWEPRLRPFLLGRRVPLRWLPVPSNVAVAGEAVAAPAPGAAEQVVIGHFGTYPPHTADRVAAMIPRLLEADDRRVMLLLGRDGERVRSRIADRAPALAARVTAPGVLPEAELSRRIARCDLLVQPFPDGVSTRRSSAMAALAHGVPLLTTSGHLTEGFWARSGAVSLVAAGDDDALAAEAERLLADPLARRRLAEAGRTLYEREFQLSRTVARLRGQLGDPRP